MYKTMRATISLVYKCFSSLILLFLEMLSPLVHLVEGFEEIASDLFKPTKH